MLRTVLDLNMPNSAAIFGSARTKADSPTFANAYSVANGIAAAGINVMTGGGPGVMEAANRGAWAAENGLSIGISILLPFEADLSVEKYHHITVRNHKFEFRQTALIENCNAYIGFEGGVGTEFEIYNVITLMQCGFIPRKQIVLFGSDIWSDFAKRMDGFVARGTICEKDLSIFHITDDVDEAVEIVKYQLNA